MFKLVNILFFITFLSILSPMFSYPLQDGSKQGVVLIPAYFRPETGDFLKLVYSKPGKTVIAALNIDNGPGTGIDESYVWAVEKLVENGITPLGYVYTSYGARAVGEVKEEIDKWFRNYPGVKGVFLDEVSNSYSLIPYYSELYDYVKNNYNGLVVLNPGTNFPVELAQYCDYSVVFEGSPEQLEDFQLDQPLTRVLDKLAFLVYGVSEEVFEQVYSTITGYGVSSLYITNDGFPNPWDSLSRYFRVLAEDSSRQWIHTMVFNDFPGDNGGHEPWTDIVSIAYSFNDFFIGWNITVAKAIPLPAGTGVFFYSILLDVDNNAGTGYAHRSIGADNLVEAYVDQYVSTPVGKLYRYNGSRSDWVWVEVGFVLTENYDGGRTIEMLIEKDSLEGVGEEVRFASYTGVGWVEADSFVAENPVPIPESPMVVILLHLLLLWLWSSFLAGDVK